MRRLLVVDIVVFFFLIVYKNFNYFTKYLRKSKGDFAKIECNKNYKLQPDKIVILNGGQFYIRLRLEHKT